jgi:tetratricopeptide (TPR) repeat protein
MSENLPSKILIIDDDQTILNQIELMLKPYKIHVEKAKNLDTALYLFNQKRYDAIIVEMEFEDLPGTVIVQKFRDSDYEGKRLTPMIISTGQSKNNAESALITELGDILTVNKPFQVGALLSILNKAVALGATVSRLDEVLNKIIRPLQNKGKHDKAIKIATSRLIPLGARGRYETSLILENAGDTDNAIKLLEDLSEAEPKNMKYINSLARIHTKNGDLNQAKIYYEQADEIAPDNLDRLNDMASLYMALHEPEKTVEKYSRILELTPEQGDLKFDLYQKLFDGGFEQHARDLCKATSTPTELIRHFNNKGVLLSKEQNFSDAISEYQKAKNLIPQSKDLYRILYNMAIAHINLKTKDDITAAHNLLKEVLLLKPDYSKAKDKLALTEKVLKINQKETA